MALNKTMTFDLELKPGGIPPIVHASQGDIGRMFKANIYWDGSAATSYISGATVNLRGRKPDKTVFDYTATLAGSMVTFETTEQMTIISGPVECELVFSNDGDIIASANFVLIVEDSPYNPDALSESVITGIVDLIEDTIGGDVRDEVQAELEAHPEWTTTVQDGAITEAKINAELLPKIKNAYVTPEMFGAVGDGTTDDTTALQAAINSALTTNKGKAVLLTKQYRVTNTLNISANNLHIRGSGQDCVILKDFSGDLFATTTTRVFYLWFEGFAVDGKYTTGSVIKSSEDYRMSSLLIKNVCIYHAEKALDLVNTYCSNIEDCVIVNNTTAIELTKANAVNISGCNITENTNGLIINSGTVISVIGNTFQTMAVPFKVLSIEDLTIVSNYFEYCDAENTNILDIDGTNSHNVNSVTIIGNRFVPNDTTYVSTITPVSLKWVVYGLYACNRMSDRYTRNLYLDSNTQYVQYDSPISPKYINESNHCRGFIVPYIEGSTSNPANALGTMAWDRYRYKPIWWDGSKWVYADGTART